MRAALCAGLYANVVKVVKPEAKYDEVRAACVPFVHGDTRASEKNLTAQTYTTLWHFSVFVFSCDIDVLDH